MGERAAEDATGVSREVQGGDVVSNLSSGDGVGGEGDLRWDCECRHHRVCHWVGHRYDVVGGQGGGVRLRLSEDKGAIWGLFESRLGLSVRGLEFPYGG